MRVGFNPNKDKVLPKSDYIHQVLVPVHIPHQHDYFKDSFKILQFCLESLFKTCHAKTYITVVNNGSCTEVVNYLNQLQQVGKLREVVHTTAIGKLNAILKGLTGHEFPLITIADADVLFLNDWQKATYEIFEAFPKAGVVSTTPSSKMIRYFTSNVLFKNILSPQMKFTQVANPDAMKSFAESVGNPDFYNKYHLEKYLTLSKGTIRAVIGAGHFVATYHGGIFDNLEQRNSIYSLGGNSEGAILDKPVLKKGYWRLSTEENYTYHMGNVSENWILDCYNAIEDVSQIQIELPNLKTKECVIDLLKDKILSGLIYNKTFWYLFLQYKGLNKEAAKNY